MDGVLEDLSQILLSLEEASHLLKINKGTLQNWLSQKRIKRVKMGGKTLVDAKAVESILIEALK